MTEMDMLEAIDGEFESSGAAISVETGIQAAIAIAGARIVSFGIKVNG